MAAIAYPDDLNGINEVGIAAGVDHFSDLAYGVTIRLRATAAAPVEPTREQVRASTLVAEWANLGSEDARVAFFNNAAAIVGATGLAKDDILAHITNFPGDEAAARALADLTDDGATDVVTAYDAWIAIAPEVRPNLEIDMDHTFRTATPPGTSAVAQRLWQGLVAYALANGWVIAHEVASRGLVRYAGPEARIGVNRTTDEVNAVGFHPAQECANLIVALKINYWLINHHVGQVEGVIEGYGGKVARLQNLIDEARPTQNREVRNVCWACGKIVSSRGTLRAVGIPGIVYADASNTGKDADNDYARGGAYVIPLSEDVRLRVRSSPAGTSNVSTFHAIVKRAIYSVFGVCIPPLTSYGKDPDSNAFVGRAKDALDAIATEPARHHMGSVFLTGQPRIVQDAWTDEEKSNLSAFMHATAPSDTLTRSASVVKLDQITGNIVYTTICTLRTSLADAVSNRTHAIMIGKMTGGGTVGGLARQFGRLTDDQIAEAQREAALADQGPVSEDEVAAANETRSNKARREARNKDRADRRAARARAGLS